MAEAGDTTAHSAPGRSLHDRILGDIEANIITGRWPPGHKIPSEQQLTAEYGCSRMTVNKVLTQLARAGLVQRRRKTGSIVLAQQSQSAILDIYDIRDEVAASGRRHAYRILSVSTEKAGRDRAKTLAVSADAPLLVVRCLHLASGKPFCLEERLINLTAVPEAADADFTATSPGPWLLQHVPWTAAEHRIAADTAAPLASAALNLPPGSAVLVVERQTWRLTDCITEVRLTYPGGQHRLTARFTPSQLFSTAPAERS
ncbi:histidine utilization repressor [Rhizobium paknamense]|uniref:Histidine utilization repressor n=1 Tax=Rhizobium paknamense TaxID=1206817 RepID=A0ABU0IFR8_9HYPH|nr:histidine utilization repressor [Rhizobium paknamense]MDQ0456275.1 GntR family histidine utilization transcriptional repressor [Rhizobium paknamense]